MTTSKLRSIALCGFTAWALCASNGMHSLEVVTPDVEQTCVALETLHGMEFGETEEPVVRPYVLVDDIESAVEAAGGVIAMPPTEIPERGSFAIYLQGGIDYGLWQM